MIRIILDGCLGTMGHVITDTFAKSDQVKIVAGVDIRGDQNGSMPYPVYTDWKDVREEADCAVDFAAAPAVDGTVEACAGRKLPLVLGTTGLSEKQLEKVRKLSQTVPLVQSYNFSLGINTMAKIIREITPVLAGAGFDIEIVEKHHNQKADAPSGTAIMLADAANEAENGRYHFVTGRSEVRRKRDPDEIGISSVRGGTIVGAHDVIFAGEDEVLELNHQAFSKAIFARGALAAVLFLRGKKPGYYSMADVIG
ncbi:MAG: 4-hydroxy-tetrahydrodipicolinate reductase [Lachnospiraceae bacterium]|jgi:4-hydroxy-tetrahydrodipicolinate reductase